MVMFCPRTRCLRNFPSNRFFSLHAEGGNNPLFFLLPRHSCSLFSSENCVYKGTCEQKRGKTENAPFASSSLLYSRKGSPKPSTRLQEKEEGGFRSVDGWGKRTFIFRPRLSSPFFLLLFLFLQMVSSIALGLWRVFSGRRCEEVVDSVPPRPCPDIEGRRLLFSGSKPPSSTFSLRLFFPWSRPARRWPSKAAVAGRDSRGGSGFGGGGLRTSS